MSKGGGHSHHRGGSSRSHHHHHHYSSGYSSRTYYSNGGNSYYSSSGDCTCHPIAKIIFVISILGTLISIPFIILIVGSHKELDMEPSQTTLKSLHPIWTKSVTITDMTGNGKYLNAAIYPTKPVISQNKTHLVTFEESPLIDVDSYMYYSYQLNQGSSVQITFSASSPINFFIQEGERQFKSFTDDVDGKYYKLKKYCDNAGSCSIQYQIGKDDIYYFTFQNPSWYSPAQVLTAKFNIQMSIYEPNSKAIDDCFGSGNVQNNPDQCNLKLPFTFNYGKKLYLLITAPNQGDNDNNHLTYPTEYQLSFNQGMVWGQGIVSLLALLLFIWLVRFFVTGKCLYKKESSTPPHISPSVIQNGVNYSTTIYTKPSVIDSPQSTMNTPVIQESTALLPSNSSIPNAYPISSINSVTPSAPVYQPVMDLNQNDINAYNDDANSSNYYNHNTITTTTINNNNDTSNSVPYGFIN